MEQQEQLISSQPPIDQQVEYSQQSEQELPSDQHVQPTQRSYGPGVDASSCLMATCSQHPVCSIEVKPTDASLNVSVEAAQLALLVIDSPECSTQQPSQRGSQCGKPCHQSSAAQQSAAGSTIQLQSGAEKWQAGWRQGDQSSADTFLQDLVCCPLTQV